MKKLTFLVLNIIILGLFLPGPASAQDEAKLGEFTVLMTGLVSDITALERAYNPSVSSNIARTMRLEAYNSIYPELEYYRELVSGRTDINSIRLWSLSEALQSFDITDLAAQGGSDPASNQRLKSVVDKAKQNNMPADNIERAIKRGSGEDDSAANWEDIVYEGYGPEGVAILVEALTDNKNRTAADVRHIFAKHGGKLGKSGTVDYLFKKVGFIQVPKANVDEDAIFEIAIEAGAEEVEDAGETWDIYTAWTDMSAVKDAITTEEFTVDNAEVVQQPSTTIKLTGKSAQKMLKMMDMFEDNDDVQDAWANFDIDISEMEAFGE